MFSCVKLNYTVSEVIYSYDFIQPISSLSALDCATHNPDNADMLS